jgi:TorA maturation chaperone TorD
MSTALLASASAPAAEASAVASAAAPEFADVFALLAAAFAPPPETLPARDWCELLDTELEALGPLLGLETAAARVRLAEAGQSATDSWLVHYSRLFLVPPVHVTLNTGVYLEGSLAGNSARVISQCYAAAGLEPSSRFHDLPDHVAMQLEFLAALLQRGTDGDEDGVAMAQEYAGSVVDYWIGPLRSACERAVDADPAAAVYAELADLVRQAIDRIRL